MKADDRFGYVGSVIAGRGFLKQQTQDEEFGQNYVRSAATSVDKSENSPQFSYINLR